MTVGELKEALKRADDDDMEVVIGIESDFLRGRPALPLVEAYQETMDGPFHLAAGRVPRDLRRG